jgi:hypothetical protein
VLGADTNNDGTVDSFFVDFNYLARNTLINANALAIAARGVTLPSTSFTAVRSNGVLTLTLDSPLDTFKFRLALRSTTNDWDTVYTCFGNSAIVNCNPTGAVYASIAGVDNWGAESLFSAEKLVQTSATDEAESIDNEPNIRLFQNRPNPFDEATWISFWVNELPSGSGAAFIQISDLQGKIIQNLPVELKQGMNEVLYTHGYGVRGTFAYALIIGGKSVDARQMIFAN